jgi:hypothetical protein
MTCKQFTNQLEHLTRLAKAGEAWKAYAWRRAKELEADPSGLWTGLCADLTLAMTQGSEHPPIGKPR